MHRVVGVGGVGPLELERPRQDPVQVPGRLEDGVRLAADVEEPGLGEEFEEEPDPPGVRRRLQEHRPVVPQRQLLQEQHERPPSSASTSASGTPRKVR